jgi:ornithine cyclodeaminase/alanine dehydrogenase-like protein (mu-crystallin family)
LNPPDIRELAKRNLYYPKIKICNALMPCYSFHNEKKSLVDDPAQAVHSGEINVPITSGIYRAADIAGTLGEVVIGKKKRAGPDTITIFDSTGLAIQDLAIAKIAMKHGHMVELPFP